MSEILYLLETVGLLSPAEAAKYLSMGKTKLYAEINSGRLKAKRHGGQTVITKEALDEWIANLPDHMPADAPMLPIKTHDQRPLVEAKADEKRQDRLLRRKRHITASPRRVGELRAFTLTDAVPIAPTEAVMANHATVSPLVRERLLVGVRRRVGADAGAGEETGDG